ncbi:DUF7261 family protein [Halorarius litoreus]|uniref:DUF7261 family protein n=1 Tax=Halorarius litoreus TaxID=2962676 RepID=UPI0020CE4E13|nr:hypothetical protein [Halorarius litoreus]
MANVNGGERGQLVLLTAVAIAALLVLVAVLLSSLVYTENVATRDDSGADARAAQLHRIAAIDAVEGLTERANRDGTSYEAFRESVAAWESQQAQHAATTGASATVTVRSTTNGTRIGQTNASYTLTNASGVGSWTLVSGATAVEGWTLTVNESSLVTPTSTANATTLAESGAFHVVATNGTVTRQAFLYRESGDVVLHVDSGAGALEPPCVATPDGNGTVTVDISARTVESTDCAALGLLDSWSGSFAIAHSNGENATGTYSLVVDRPIDEVDDGDVTTGGGGTPFAAPHTADVRIDVTYTTADLRYRVWNVPVEEDAP